MRDNLHTISHIIVHTSKFQGACNYELLYSDHELRSSQVTTLITLKK